MVAKVLVVAGEASADLHAGHVFARLREYQNFELLGIGGDHLQKLGLRPIANISDMAVVGLTEALTKVYQTLRLIRELEVIAEKERPAFALLIDLPDFNLHLAPRLKSLGIPVIYYVSPQVWAWRSKRVRFMAKVLNRLLCILPFEQAWYAKHAPANLRVEYVGHPAVEEIPNLPYSPDPNLIAILPGSRVKELKSLFPALVGAAVLLKRKNPSLRFELPLALTLRGNPEIAYLLSGDGECHAEIAELGNSLRVLEQPAPEVLRRAKLALVASGTATLETALVGTPMVVVYKVTRFSAFLFKRIVSYRGPVAMANIIHVGLESQERVVPELLQENVNPQRIFQEASAILEKPELWQAMKQRLGQTRAILSHNQDSPIDAVVGHLREFL